MMLCLAITSSQEEGAGPVRDRRQVIRRPFAAGLLIGAAVAGHHQHHHGYSYGYLYYYNYGYPYYSYGYYG